MALVDEVITRYSLQDHYSEGVEKMAEKTRDFADAASEAQGSTRGLMQTFTQLSSGSAAGSFLTGFAGGAARGGAGGLMAGISGFLARFGAMAAILGAVVIAGQKFNEFLEGINGFLKGLAEGGGILTQLVTLPGKIIIAIYESLGSLFQSLTGSLVPVIGIATQLAMLPFTLTNAAIATLAKSLEVLVSVIGQVAQAVGQIAGEIGGMLAELGVKAIMVATDFDTMQRSMAAFLGGPAQGAQMMQFLRERQNLFDLKPTLEAARAIVLAGREVTGTLRILERIAFLKGAEPENLERIVQMFMTAMATNNPQLLMSRRGLAGFGVTQEMLKAHGAQFDGNQFVGGMDDLMAVLSRLVNSPDFERLVKHMSEGPGKAWSDAMDQIERAMKEVGDVLANFIMPHVREFTTALSKLVENGIIKQIAEGFLSMFGAGQQGSITSFLNLVAASLMNLPMLIEAVWEVVKKGGAMLLQFMTTLWDTMVTLTNKMISKLEGIIAAFVGFMRALIPFNLDIPQFPKLPTVAEAMSGAGDLWKELSGFAGEKFADFADAVMRDKERLDALGSGATGATDPTLGTVGIMSEIATATKETARNTREILDLSRTALGGGDIGRFGVMPIEQRGVRGQIRVDVRGAGDALSRAIQEVLEQFLPQYERQRTRVEQGRA